MLLLTLLLSSVACYALPGGPSFGGSWHHHDSKYCKFSEIKVRKEWSSLSIWDRKAFTDAVTCLQSKPSQIPPEKVPNATLTRYDDYIATHINQTLKIHGDAYFLGWHRHYLHTFEQDLVNLCGFNGTLPYWNWPIYAEHLENSTLFDGSPYSMGSNGVFNATLSVTDVVPGVTVPNGTGGGCLYSGPFVNQVVPFQPVPFSQIFTFGGVLPADALAYTPRCLTRNLNDYISSHFTNQAAVEKLFSSPTIAAWDGDVDDFVPNPLELGPHIAGHLSFQGYNDFFGSPSDPAFFLHHAMVDLVWTIWQALDPYNRQYAISGTRTSLNIPPSPNGTLHDFIEFDYVTPQIQLVDAMNVWKAPYCYVYDYDY